MGRRTRTVRTVAGAGAVASADVGGPCDCAAPAWLEGRRSVCSEGRRHVRRSQPALAQGVRDPHPLPPQPRPGAHEPRTWCGMAASCLSQLSLQTGNLWRAVGPSTRTGHHLSNVGGSDFRRRQTRTAMRGPAPLVLMCPEAAGTAVSRAEASTCCGVCVDMARRCRYTQQWQS